MPPCLTGLEENGVYYEQLPCNLTINFDKVPPTIIQRPRVAIGRRVRDRRVVKTPSVFRRDDARARASLILSGKGVCNSIKISPRVRYIISTLLIFSLKAVKKNYFNNFNFNSRVLTSAKRSEGTFRLTISTLWLFLTLYFFSWDHMKDKILFFCNFSKTMFHSPVFFCRPIIFQIWRPWRECTISPLTRAPFSLATLIARSSQAARWLSARLSSQSLSFGASVIPIFASRDIPNRKKSIL